MQPSQSKEGSAGPLRRFCGNRPTTQRTCEHRWRYRCGFGNGRKGCPVARGLLHRHSRILSFCRHVALLRLVATSRDRLALCELGCGRRGTRSSVRAHIQETRAAASSGVLAIIAPGSVPTTHRGGAIGGCHRSRKGQTFCWACQEHYLTFQGHRYCFY